jgi:amidohydrolase
MKRLNDIASYESYLIETRRKIHMNPEVGFDVFETAQFVASELRRFGFTVYEGVGISSVVGVLRGIEKKKVIGLRADMDALSMTEENKDIPYCSRKPGLMHACGHDCHTAMLLAACKFFCDNKHLLEGTVKVVFQAAEEGPLPGGGTLVVESGLLDDVEAFFALHVTNILPEGHVSIKVGQAMAASDKFTLRVIGKGGHAAYPHLAVDPIVMSAQIVLALQTLVSRVLDPTHAAVITIGQIESGTAFNIIPETVLMKGTVRTLDENDRTVVFEKIKDVCEHVTAIYGGDFKLDVHYGYPVLMNDAKSAAFYRSVIEKSLGKDKFVQEEKPSMGGEDFAYYLRKARGTLAWLGGRNKEAGLVFDNHHPKFNIDEKALLKGMLIHVNTVFEFLKTVE